MLYQNLFGVTARRLLRVTCAALGPEFSSELLKLFKTFAAIEQGDPYRLPIETDSDVHYCQLTKGPFDKILNSGNEIPADKWRNSPSTCLLCKHPLASCDCKIDRKFP